VRHDALRRHPRDGAVATVPAVRAALHHVVAALVRHLGGDRLRDQARFLHLRPLGSCHRTRLRAIRLACAVEHGLHVLEERIAREPGVPVRVPRKTSLHEVLHGLVAVAARRRILAAGVRVKLRPEQLLLAPGLQHGGGVLQAELVHQPQVVPQALILLVAQRSECRAQIEQRRWHEENSDGDCHLQARSKQV